MSHSGLDRNLHDGLLAGLGGKGVLCLALGLVVLVVADWIAPRSHWNELADAIRPVGWIAIAVGAVFVGLHLLGRSGRQPSQVREDPSMGLTRPSALSGLRDAGGSAVIEPVFVDTIAVNPLADDEADAAAADDPHATPRESEWNANVLANIDAARFEQLCLAFYAQAGFSTSSRAHETEGGIDIWLQSRLMPAPRIVRCKYWGDQTVELKSMRDFLADMSTHGLQNGTYVTSSSFDADATEFAKANGVQVQDAQSLLKLILQRSALQQGQLLEAAYRA